MQQLGARQRNPFWHLCPDFVVEVRSDRDRLKPLQKKMVEYLEQGAQLGWLIDPHGDLEKLTCMDKVEGEGPVVGLVLDLKYVWDPFTD